MRSITRTYINKRHSVSIIALKGPKYTEARGVTSFGRNVPTWCVDESYVSRFAQAASTVWTFPVAGSFRLHFIETHRRGDRNATAGVPKLSRVHLFWSTRIICFFCFFSLRFLSPAYHCHSLKYICQQTALSRASVLGCCKKKKKKKGDCFSLSGELRERPNFVGNPDSSSSKKNQQKTREGERKKKLQCEGHRRKHKEKVGRIFFISGIGASDLFPSLLFVTPEFFSLPFVLSPDFCMESPTVGRKK